MAFDKSAIGWKSLNVTRNGKKQAMLVANMTDGEIASALARADNAGALAAGWMRNAQGQVVRQAAPPAPSTPAPPRHDPAEDVPPAGGPPTSGYLKVRQKQKDGSWKVVLVHRSKLTATQIAAALKNGFNGGGASTVATGAGTGTDGTPVVDPGAGGGGGGAAPVGGGSGAAPVGGGSGGAIASWIPPQIGLGGLNADPMTGRIDWSKLIAAANEISAVDLQYAQDIRGNLLQAMQSVMPMQSEIQSLTAINPSTGKTLYQQLFDTAQQQYKQNTSRTFGTAAARGIGSSGMVNSTLANQTVDLVNQQRQANSQYGNQRITDLLRGMTDQLQAQDTNFMGSYQSALSRAYGGIPQIPGVE